VNRNPRGAVLGDDGGIDLDFFDRDRLLAGVADDNQPLSALE